MVEYECISLHWYLSGCHGKPCVRTPAKTWEAAHKDCRLTKPTISSNWYNLYQISDRQCWMGLYRSIEGKFINGKEQWSNDSFLFLIVASFKVFYNY